MPPRLIVDIGRVLFLGCLHEVPSHAPMVQVLAAGLDRNFQVRTDEASHLGRLMMSPAGQARCVEGFGARMAVMLIDPGRVVRQPMDEQRVITLLDSLCSAFDPMAWHALGDELGLNPAGPPIPEKIAQAAALILNTHEQNLPVQQLAQCVGLSVSRLEHLFSQAMGIPLRSYRTWCRFRAAALTMSRGGNQTEAAHAAGFHDSAHFQNAYRRAFGLPPSFVFRPGLQTWVVGESVPDSP